MGATNARPLAALPSLREGKTERVQCGMMAINTGRSSSIDELKKMAGERRRRVGGDCTEKKPEAVGGDSVQWRSSHASAHR